MISYRVHLNPDDNGAFLVTSPDKQEVDRILDLNHATNLAKIEHAFEVLGKKLLIDVRDADDRAA